MLPDLETLFVKKCNDHVGLKLLAAQWEFDKLLLAKALQNIQVNFSHYSRHDESHSKQILINIERMLGEKTECFTATDLWLLLEAAYSHDIGMVITQKQIYDLDTNEFKSYVEELTEDSEGELYEFAINWLSDNAQLPQGSKSYKFIYKYKQLIAEWYRRKHSQNSSRYIKNPVAEIGLNSPRNELLPKRLFNILGDVCESHGLPFEDVMKLPYTEAGLGVDDCHPRFIACLLRMGDLLDVDENRFCPIMMNISGNNLPDSSILHFEKHQSIKHLRIDSERIKIEVECATPAVYEIAYDWFRWVETEYHRQSQNWPKIVPSKEFGKLPSLSTPLVTVKKPYVILHEGEKPSFGINKNKTLNMFRSAGLYNEEFDFVREVLQNAVDATLIAMWQDSKKELSNISPYSSEFDRILSNYSIDSNFEKSNGKIKVSIQDQGVGISRTELDNVFNVGGGQIKTNKNKIISEMPQWLKPSGNFGIGLQSLFIVTDSFKIITKSKETHDCYEIEFFSKYNKGIEIKKINNDNVMYGTLVEFYIDEVKFPKSISYDDLYGKKDKYVKLFNDYDITDDSSDLGDYQLLKLIEGVSKFNNFSMIKVKNNYLYENTNTDCDLFANYFSKELNIYLGDIDFIDSLSGNISDYTFFKGQRFSGINRILPIVTGYVDYHGYNAIGFLSYNRDKILKSAIPNAIDNLNQAILEYIDSEFDSISDDKKPLAAAYWFIINHDKIDNTKDINKYKKYINFIDKLRVKCGSDSYNIKCFSDVCENIRNQKVTETVVYIDKYRERLPESDNGTVIEVSDLVQKLLKLILTKESIYWVSKNYNPEILREHAMWSNSDNIPLEKDRGIHIFSGKDGKPIIGNRIIFPCWGEYRKLSISINAQWARIIEHEQNDARYMILPLKVNCENKLSKDTSDELIEWIYSSLVEKITKDEIRDLIESLYLKIREYYCLEIDADN